MISEIAQARTATVREGDQPKQLVYSRSEMLGRGFTLQGVEDVAAFMGYLVRWVK